jgi:hypothetical protein
LIFQAASNASISPLRLSFTGTLRVVRRALPKFQGLQPQELPFFLSWLTLEIIEQNIPERVSEKQPKSREKACLKFSV